LRSSSVRGPRSSSGATASPTLERSPGFAIFVSESGSDRRPLMASSPFAVPLPRSIPIWALALGAYFGRCIRIPSGDPSMPASLAPEPWYLNVGQRLESG
jgi:hypothetical protein